MRFPSHRSVSCSMNSGSFVPRSPSCGHVSTVPRMPRMPRMPSPHPGERVVHEIDEEFLILQSWHSHARKFPQLFVVASSAPRSATRAATIQKVGRSAEHGERDGCAEQRRGHADIVGAFVERRWGSSRIPQFRAAGPRVRPDRCRSRSRHLQPGRLTADRSVWWVVGQATTHHHHRGSVCRWSVDLSSPTLARTFHGSGCASPTPPCQP